MISRLGCSDPFLQRGSGYYQVATRLVIQNPFPPFGRLGREGCISMSASHQFLKAARQIHLYVGVFIAPALLFFAFTGGLQVFSLHETTRGSDYKPPAWLVTLAQVHKKQTTMVPSHKPHPADSANAKPDHEDAAPSPTGSAPMAQTPPDAPRAPAKNPLPLKIFFAFVSLGLFVSTLLGIYMAYRYSRKPAMLSVLLIAGVVVPVLLALM
jgi:hypothetical protein